MKHARHKNKKHESVSFHSVYRKDIIFTPLAKKQLTNEGVNCILRNHDVFMTLESGQEFCLQFLRIVGSRDFSSQMHFD